MGAPLVDEQLEVSFLSQQALILSKSSIMTDPSRLVDGLLRVLNDVLAQLKAAAMYPIVIRQIFHQIIFHISARLANQLLTTPEMCSPTVAMSIKMGVSFVNA